MTVAGRDVFLSIVSDGAGSAIFGKYGALLACRTFGVSVSQWISRHKRLPTEQAFNSSLDQTRDAIYFASRKRGLTLRDFAATLIAVISDGYTTVVFHIGDGGATLRNATAGEWINLSWPTHGEYASSTNFLTDEPAVKYFYDSYLGEVDAIAIFTDGLERLALDFKTQRPHAGFFDAFCMPLKKTSGFGRNAILSGKLYDFLGSPAINSRTDDDKTLVVAIR
jgi:hypothetical protein